MQNTTTTITPVYNLVILDKSGSMESIRKETIDGHAETATKLRLTEKKASTSL